MLKQETAGLLFHVSPTGVAYFGVISDPIQYFNNWLKEPIVRYREFSVASVIEKLHEHPGK